MAADSHPAPPEVADPDRGGRRRRRRRRLWIALSAFALLLLAGRLALPSVLRWYVNRTLDHNIAYAGRIDEIDVHLWRGAYSIRGVRILKRTGDVPVPLFAADGIDLAIDWDALLQGTLRGRLRLERPVLNFVDDSDDSGDQTGAGEPWLRIVDELFPFAIDDAEVRDGSMHFRAFHQDPQVDVWISGIHGTLEDLTNVQDDLTPLFATVQLEGKAMDQADLELEMKFDPTSYRPTFQLALRLLGLDVTKTRALTRAYGAFDFEDGWFDLVVELDAREGRVDGYAKPLFRDIRVVDLARDLAEDNVFEVFWEALVGLVGQVFRNHPRDQIGVRIPIAGDLTSPQSDVLATIGSLLHNAFVRAYLPKLEGVTPALDGVTFGPAVDLAPAAVK